MVRGSAIFSLLRCYTIMAVQSSSLLLRCYAIVRGGAIFSLLHCYTITVLAKILLYLLLRCYTMASGAIIFFVICYYVVTLLQAVLLFSLLYYRHCFYFLSYYRFKFHAWIIFFWQFT